MSSDITEAAPPSPIEAARRLLARRNTRWIVAALLGAAALVAWRFYPSDAPSPPGAGGKGPAIAVAAAEVTSGDFPVVFSGLGTVTAAATSIVKPQVSGPLTQVSYVEGQMVKAGDRLARIDPRPFELAVAQAEAQLQKDESLLQNAERDLARYESLRTRLKDSVSGQQLDTQRSLIGQYRATVELDRALVGQAKLNLSYTHIAAPIDGRIGLRLVDPGNIVQTNDASGIAVVTRLTPITVIFTLPEVKLQSVLRRFRSGEKLFVAAFNHEHSGELARGVLYAIDNQIDASSGTVKLRAEFANDDETLYPNQFVNAELTVETLKSVVLVPAAAIQRGARGPFVYMFDGEDKVAVRPVRLGPGDSERAVIEEGLRPGQRVVVEGVDRLRDGARVIVARGPGSEKNGASADGRRPQEKAAAR
ncbi:efflux RND transporter periplasmic adaptor subunit [Methylosinus sporium]|uniref:efflux RND transporter periplasmic adaptor subunit n=1 Tax=Methylosinus sporium TaxID=428 RepID=UPI000D5907EE|nr:efflux RND transporter periplasmic adaptor subunit [Methylosinus sporium]PWB89308.1 multidrug transporter subunit MdtA [Methylocystis sp. MitZ-2018]